MSYAENLGQMAFDRSYESLEDAPTDEIISLLEVKTAQALTFDGIRNRLNEDRPIRVKFGTDPTGPDLHIGHVAPIRILDIFSRAGHEVDLIFGDFTAKVGDPSGRSSERQVLSDERIAENMTTFRSQVDKYFDTYKPNVRLHTNGTWLGRMSLSEVFGYLQNINLTEAVQRNDFRERMQKGHTVSLAETMYGTMMGIDSIQLGTEIEVGGIDQLLNFQQTRTIQRSVGQDAEDVIMSPLLEGTAGDGRKMSKSYGNYVPLRADTDEIFGKIMSIPDTLIVPYITTFAPIYTQEVAGLQAAAQEKPYELKKQLALYMAGLSVSDYDKGLEAKDQFERRYSQRIQDAENAIVLTGAGNVALEVLHETGDFKSRSDIRRLAGQGGVSLNGQKLTLAALLETVLKPDDIIAVGKRKLYRLGPDESEADVS